MATLFDYPDSNLFATAKGDAFKALALSYSKAAYYNYNTGYQTNIGFVNNANYRINRSYGLGKQDIQQYKDMLDCGDNKNETYYDKYILVTTNNHA